LAEEKAVAPVKKKVVAEKQAAKAKVPVVKKKPVAEKKVAKKVAEPAALPTKEKAAPSVEKKVVTKKKVVPAKVPAAEPKVVAAKKVAKTEAKLVKKPVAAKKVEQKVAEKPASAEKKVVPKETATEPAVAPVKEEKVAEEVAPAVEKKPVAEKKVAPKIVKPPRKEWTGNPMLKPIIEKVTVNMSVGQSGRPLEQAETVLKQLTNQKPSKRKAKKTIREFGIRKGESIACLVTLRDEKAEVFLRKAFYAIDKKLSKYCFDRQGNFSFGIKEHIDIPGTKYSPELGIHGMDVSVSLGRAGYRVKRRHRVKSKLGKGHLLTPDEAILFIKDEFDVEIM
jgi:large subunit ribosomal protein L5